MRDPIDAELEQLIDDYEAENDRFPTPAAGTTIEPQLDPASEALYAAAWGQEVAR